MKLLYLVHRTPFPPNKGDKIRTFNILRCLARDHQVHLAALVDDADDEQYLPDLGRIADSVTSSNIYGRLRKILSLRAIARLESVTVRHFYDRNLQKQIDQLLYTEAIDAVVCSSSPTAEYLFRSRHWKGTLQQCLKIMDLIDVDSLKWQQYAESTTGPKGWVYNYEARHLREFESKIYRYFDKVLLVSEQEMRSFPGGDPDSKLVSVPNGVDLEYFVPVGRSEGQTGAPTVAFTGMMDYLPNIEGMRWFLDSVFPRIQQEVPDARVFVIGGKPTAEVQAWGAIPGVEVTGFVDDIREYVAQADVCIAPLRIARGVQNKVLEAMAMGKAVVTTEFALDGIGAEAGKDVAVANSAVDFADRVVELLHDGQQAARLGKSARCLMEEKYSWPKSLSYLESLLNAPDEPLTGLVASRVKGAR